jgi:hypothetical protein
VTVEVADNTADGYDGNAAVSVSTTLSVADVNEEASAVVLDNLVTTLDENTDTSARIKIADIVVTDDALGTNALTLSGADAALFEIDGTELYLRAGTVLNFEGDPSFDVTVEVADNTADGYDGNAAASVSTTLNVTDVNEAATAVTLSNVINTIDENTDTSSSIKVADISVTDDALGTNVLSLSGADSAKFEIVDNAGSFELHLRAGETLDFEADAGFDVTVNVDDAGVGGTPDASANFTLNINDVAEGSAPTDISFVTTGTTQVASEDFESSVAGWTNAVLINDEPVAFTGFLGDSIAYNNPANEAHSGDLNIEDEQNVYKTFQLSGDQTSVTVTFDFYEIDAWSGEEFLVWFDDQLVSNHLFHRDTNEDYADTNPYAAPTNIGFNNDIAGNDQKHAYTLTFNTTADNIKIGFGSSLDENWDEEKWGVDNLVITENVGSTTGTFSLAEDAADGTVVATMSATDADSGDTFTYALVDAQGDPVVDSNFEIVGNEIRVKAGAELDYETATSHTLRVQVTDSGGLTYVEDVTINLTDVNEEASAVELQNLVTTLDENTDTSARIKIADIVVTDDALGTNALTLSGADAALFEIDGTELYLRAGISLDFETKNSFDVNVTVTDATAVDYDGDAAASVSNTLNITNINEAPTDISFVTTGTTQVASEDYESALSGWTNGVIVNEEPVAFTGFLSDANAYANRSAGNYYQSSGIEDTQSVYKTFNLSGNQTSVTVTFDFYEIDSWLNEEFFVWFDDQLVSSNTYHRTQNEDYADTTPYAAPGQLGFGSGSNARNDQKHAYTLTFNTTADNIKIGFGSSLDEEWDDEKWGVDNLVITEDVGSTTTGTISLAEDAADGTVVATMSATDPDSGDTFTYALVDVNGDPVVDSNFEIVGNEIRVKAGAELDYETATSHTLKVQVTDSGGLTYVEDVTINVTDVNEAPTEVTLNNTVTTLAENADTSSSTKVADIGITDDALGTNTLSLSGTDAASFEIVNIGGNYELHLRSGVSLDYESKTSYDVNVNVDDSTVGGTPDASQSFTLNITDTNEAPTDINFVGTPQKVGAEFAPINSAPDLEIQADMAALDDGGYVIVWTHYAADFSSISILGQRYDSDGNTVGAQFQVNTHAMSEKFSGKVATLEDGGFVVSWASGDQDGDGLGVFGQRYDASGNAVGSEFQINTNTIDDQYDHNIVALKDGGFTVTWSSEGQDGSGSGIYGQRYDASGNAVGSEARINTYTNGDQFGSTIIALDDGGFVVTWSSDGQDGNDFGIFAKRYDINGNVVGNEIQVNTTTSGAQLISSITALNNGDMVVAWSSDGQDGDGFGIFGQRYDVNGNAIGSEFQINSTTADDQIYPTVKALSDGGYFVVWTSFSSETTSDIYGQRYDANGDKVGTELKINTDTLGEALNISSFIELSDGGLIVSYTDFVSDPPSAQTYAQKLVYSSENIREDISDGGVVKILDATDPDSGDTFTYALVDVNGDPVTDNNFEIVGNEIRVKAGANLDYETATSHTLRVQVTDSGGNTYAEDVTINLADINEAPTAVTLSNVVNTIDENSDTTNSIKVADIAITDDALGTNVLSLSGADSAKFQIVDNAGNFELHLRAGETLDFESDSGFDVTVNVDDAGVGASPDASTNYSLSVTDRNEEASAVQLNNLVTDINENTDTSARIKIADIAVTDDALGTNALTLSGADANLFEIDGNELFLKAGTTLNFEGDPSFDVTVEVADTTADGYDGNAAATVSTTLNVTDINEAPTDIHYITSGSTQVVSENFESALSGWTNGVIVNDEPVAFTGFLSDNISYSSRNDGNAAVSVANTQSVYKTFQLSGNQTSVTLTFDFYQIDSWDGENFLVWMNDAIISSYNTSSDVHTYSTPQTDGTMSLGFSGGTSAFWTDQIHNYTITFNTTDTNFKLGFGSSLDEAWGNEAWGVDNLFITENVATNTTGIFSLAENTASGTVVTTLAAADPDSGDTFTYALVDAQGDPVVDSNFEIVGNEIRVKAGANLDYETATSHTLRVQVTDSSGLAYVEDVTINLTDVNEAPTDIIFADTPQKSGTETLVNTYTNSTQQDADIAALNDDGYIVVWDSYAQDSGSSNGIYGQRYDASGNPSGSEFLINTTTINGQQQPSVTSLNDGGFVVTWDSWNQDGDNHGIFGQRFDSFGVAQGSEFQVNTYMAGSQNRAETFGLSDGGFIVLWDSEGQDGAFAGIYAQRYDPAGNTVGSEFLVNTTTNHAQHFKSISALDDGSYVVVWESWGQDGDEEGIIGQRFDSDWNKSGSEFQINTTISGDQLKPSISTLNDGSFVVVWESDGQDGSGLGIYGQRFDSSGVAQGSEFQVNTYTTNDQSEPSVTALTDGGFVVVWESNGQDGSGDGIYGQRYDAAGSAVGTEFQISTTTALEQSRPTVTALKDGSFIVSWDSDGQDGDMTGVYTQKFTYSQSSIQENISDGGVVKILDATDPDSGDTFTYALVDAQGDPVVDSNFEIVGNEIRVKAGAELDYETATSHTLRVQVTDSGGLTYVEDVTINLADVNEAPTDIQLSLLNALDVNQNALNANIVASNINDFPSTAITVEVRLSGEPNASNYNGTSQGALFSYAVPGEDDEFLIHSKSGYIFVDINGNNYNTGLSYNNIYDNTPHTLSVTWDSTSGEINIYLDGVLVNSGTHRQGYTIQQSGTITLAQDQDNVGGGFSSAQSFVGTLHDVRVFNDVRTAQEISDNADGYISDPANESGLLYNWQMQSNGAGGIIDATGNKDLTISGDAVLSGGDISLSEDAASGTVVTTLSATDPDSGDTFTYALVDVNGDPVVDSNFEIVGNEIRVKAGAELDYETATSHTLRVEVTDSSGNTYAEDITVNITDRNEEATAVTLSNVVTDIDENTDTTNRIKIADISVTDDALGTNALTLSGADAALFEIDGTELFLRAGTTLNFEGDPSFDVTVEVADNTADGYDGNAAASVSTTLSVADVNEEASAVELQNLVTTLDENTDTSARIKIADIVVTDDALGTNTLSLSGADAASFEIVNNGGNYELHLQSGVSLDYETKTSYDVTVNVDDSTVGGSPDASQSFTLNITDVAEGSAPTDISFSNVSDTGQAQVETLSPVGYWRFDDAGNGDNSTAFDSSSTGQNGTYHGGVTLGQAGPNGSISNSAAVFDGNDDYVIIPDNAAYDLTDGTISMWFRTDDMSSEQYLISRDADGNQNGHLGISIEDGEIQVRHQSSSSSYFIDTTGVNITTGQWYHLSYSWGANGMELYINGVSVGSNAYTGGLNNDLDWNIGQHYGGGSHFNGAMDELALFGSQLNTTQVGDLYNSVQNGSDLASGTILESAAVGTVVTTLSATDPDSGDTFTYALVDVNGDPVVDSNFEIVGNEIRVKAGAELDYETATSHTLRVQVTDSGGLTYVEDVTINLTDVNEEASAVELQNLVTTLDENTDTSARIKIADIVVTDDALGTNALTLSGADAALFEIDGTELYLRAGTTLNFEGDPSFDVTVEVADSAAQGYDGNAAVSVSTTLNVTDVNEAPTDINPGLTKLQTNTGAGDATVLAGNISNFPTTSLSVEITLSGDEAANDHHSNQHGNLFSYATANEDDEFIIRVENDKITVSIDNSKYVSNIEDSTIFDNTKHTLSVTWESSTGSLKIYIDGALAESATHAQGRTIETGGTIALAQDQDSVGGSFSSNQRFIGDLYDVRLFDDVRTAQEIADNSNIYISDPANEGGLLYNWQMQSNGSGGILDEAGNQDMTIAGDASLELIASLSVAENAADGLVVTTLSATDPDSGDTFTYAIVDAQGDPVVDSNFEIVGNEIRVKTGHSLDYETATSHVIKVKVTDSYGNTYTEDVTINITDILDTAVDPVWRLNLDETSGTTANDEFGNHNGTLNGGVVVGAAAVSGLGTSYEFDGVDDYVQIDDSAAFDVDNGTILLSFNADVISGNQALIVRDGNGYGGGGHFKILLNGNGGLTMRFQSDSTDYNFSSANNLITAGTDHTIAFAFGDDGAKLYLDGNLVDSDVYTGGLMSNDRPFVIGADHSSTNNTDGSGYSNYFDGRIDNVSFYDLQLSDADLAQATTRTVTLTAGDDSYTAGGVGEYIQGGVGVDTITGGAGADHIDGGATGDIIYGGDGADIIDGGRSGDTLYGDGGNDTIYGGTGYDNIFGGDGNDTIDGGVHNDTIDGGDGTDTVIYSGNRHHYSITENSGTYTIVDLRDGSPDGTDTVTNAETYRFNDGDIAVANILDDNPDFIGTSSGETLDGSGSNEVFYGMEGNDTITGRGGSDIIYGGAGDDTIQGMGLDDFAYGESGHDRYISQGGYNGGVEGDDYFAGGAGGGWTDVIELQNYGTYGADWTVNITSGSITDTQADHLVLSDDASGTITNNNNGDVLTFDEIERIEW